MRLGREGFPRFLSLNQRLEVTQSGVTARARRIVQGEQAKKCGPLR